jgi:hypothetical protein
MILASSSSLFTIDNEPTSEKKRLNLKIFERPNKNGRFNTEKLHSFFWKHLPKLFSESFNFNNIDLFS